MILSVSLDEESELVKQMVEAKSLSWSQGLVGDIQNQNSARALGIGSVPLYILLDPEGKIVVRTYNLGEANDSLKSCLGFGQDD